jgi:YHS domain-containing protein
MSTLNDRVLQRLERHRQQAIAAQKQLDHDMKTDLDNHEQFCAAANRILNEIIRPRMGELACHFANATLPSPGNSHDTSCFCSFAHSLQFPATVTLNLSLMPIETRPEAFTVRYDLEILPVFMEYRKSDSLQAGFTEDDTLIIQWVEERLLEFLDTYLKLETHPLYQKDNLVLDPVCGMRIPVISASCKTEHNGKIVCFCSEHCRNAFLTNK